MLQSIAKVGSSSVAPLRTCARCIQSSRSKIYMAVNGVDIGKTFSTASATGSTISIDDPPTAYSASAEAGPSRNRMRNVWS